jgi:hypothetical protein
MTPFSAKCNARNLSLFGVAGGLLLIALVATVASNGADAPQSKASNLSSDTPLANAVEENKADEQSEDLSQPASHTSSAAQSTHSTDTDVEVNGQNIPVPENGEVHRVITENNSHTTVDITTQSGDTTYSTDINVRSFSSDND